MYENNEISVPKKQKIFAYLFLFLVIITFSTMRSQKMKASIENSYNLTKSIETSIKESLTYLYNNDLDNTNCDYIDKEYTEKLKAKFKEPNSIMAEEYLKLSYIKLDDKKIYKTKIDSEPFIIYSGNVDLKWSYENKDDSTDILTKEISVYLKDNNGTLTVADIRLNDIQ